MLWEHYGLPAFERFRIEDYRWVSLIPTGVFVCANNLVYVSVPVCLPLSACLSLSLSRIVVQAELHLFCITFATLKTNKQTKQNNNKNNKNKNKKQPQTENRAYSCHFSNSYMVASIIWERADGNGVNICPWLLRNLYSTLWSTTLEWRHKNTYKSKWLFLLPVWQSPGTRWRFVCTPTAAVRERCDCYCAWWPWEGPSSIWQCL